LLHLWKLFLFLWFYRKPLQNICSGLPIFLKQLTKKNHLHLSMQKYSF
jgi:hypothetical protein